MFLLSNSNTKIINELYEDFTRVEVTVGRHINNKNKGESKKNNEVLIFNYSNLTSTLVIFLSNFFRTSSLISRVSLKKTV